MTDQPGTAVTVTDNPAENRYEAEVDGRLAGVAEYDLRPGIIVFTHTEVGDEFGGRGVGSALVSWALDDVRRSGLRVVPRCPFVAAYMRAHAERYGDLLRSA